MARLTWLDFLLAALLAWGCWAVAAAYRDSASRDRIFDSESLRKDLPSAPRSPAATPVRSAAYASITRRLFFAPPRAPGNDSPVRRVGPDEAAPTRLPVLFGIADLGNGPSALLASAPGQRAQWISPGQGIGGYLLREISDTQLVFARGSRRFAASPEDLRTHRARLPTRPAGVGGARSRPARSASRQAASARLPATRSGYRIGTEFRPGRFAADAGDGAEDGTVFEGYVRRVRETPFGAQHWWEKRAP